MALANAQALAVEFVTKISLATKVFWAITNASFVCGIGLTVVWCVSKLNKVQLTAALFVLAGVSAYLTQSVVMMFLHLFKNEFYVKLTMEEVSVIQISSAALGAVMVPGLLRALAKFSTERVDELLTAYVKKKIDSISSKEKED